MSTQHPDEIVTNPNLDVQLDAPQNPAPSDPVKPTIEELEAKISQLDEFARKNREENASYRRKNRELKSRLEEVESKSASANSKKLEEQGQYKALYEDTKSKFEGLEREKNELYMQLRARELKGKFKTVAADKGCSDSELAFVLAQTKYKDMIDFDDEKTLTVNERSINDIVEKIKLDHSTLFKQSPLDTKEKGGGKIEVGNKSLKDMSKAEKLELLRTKTKLF